jgi:hypothetical protein
MAECCQCWPLQALALLGRVDGGGCGAVLSSPCTAPRGGPPKVGGGGKPPELDDCLNTCCVGGRPQHLDLDAASLMAACALTKAKKDTNSSIG